MVELRRRPAEGLLGPVRQGGEVVVEEDSSMHIYAFPVLLTPALSIN